ncbi:17096_t:CDS:10 [Acaulospora colombiana]|uniref:17096_t:CDS:1 n=1 Tax=Acaulospora colombiana TaxID=27376 RepID=A0ACA9L6K2_9GLOM|nr:17096_t:CDS:10 [Acaulospora colombiana]
MSTSESGKGPRPIRRLEDTVVNRIAAGEIIHRPANALKELIENSLDAGATNIQILIKDGGLKLLQIQDNGHGIRREDMAIVCERFTTSKLKSFEDLSRISTFGFRGEALASISHVAHVTITTKTADSNCAYRACYSDGKLIPSKPGASAEPKACAGNTGTQITQSSNQVDVNTLSTASKLENIRQIYGSTASELLDLEKHFRKLDLKVNGFISNANYNLKKMRISISTDRAVESVALKRNIEGVYETYLPKNSYPFVYLSLDINPQCVDVNVHPTKREVRFLNEEEIVAAVGDAIQERLVGANCSRIFLTQTLLPCSKQLDVSANEAENSIKKSGIIKTEVIGSERNPHQQVHIILCQSLGSKVLTYKYVRTDSRAQTLDQFCTPDNNMLCIPKKNKGSDVAASPGSEELFYQLTLQEFSNFAFIHLSTPAPIKELVIFALESSVQPSENLKSNQEIAQIIVDTLISRRQMLLEYFSLTISERGELVTLPLILKGYAPNLDKLPTFLLRLGSEVDWETELGCFETLSREFGLFYAPEPPLPSDPQEIAELGGVNSMDVDPLEDQMESPDDKNIGQTTEQRQITEVSKYRWQIEHIIFPTLKGNQFMAPGYIAEEGHVIQIANLPDLYRIFERC